MSTTFSLTDLVTIATLVVVVTSYVITTRNAAAILGIRLQNIDSSITDFKDELKKLQEVVVSQATQANRIELLDQRTMQQGRRLDRVGSNIVRLLMKLDMDDDVPEDHD